MPYEAGSNYIDSQPENTAAFPTFDAAKRHLVSEMRMWADYTDTDEQETALREAAAAADSQSGPFRLIVDGCAYWVREA